MLVSRRQFVQVSGFAVAACASGLMMSCASAPAAGTRFSTSDVQLEEQSSSELQGHSFSATSASASSSNQVERPALLPGMLVVTEYAGNSVAVLDASGSEVKGRIATGPNPAYMAMVGASVYVSISGGGAVLQIPASHTDALRSIEVGTQPLAICANQVSESIIVADYMTSTLSVIDTKLASVVNTIPMARTGYHNRTDPPSCCLVSPGVGRRPTFMMSAVEQDCIYTLNYGTYDISTINYVTGEEIAIFDGVVGPRQAALSPDGSTLFVAGVGGEEEEKVSTLYCVDASTGERVREYTVGVGVSGVAISPDGSTLYAIARDGGVLVSINLETQEENMRLNLTPGIEAIDVSPDGSRIFITNSVAGELYCIDTLHLDLVNTMQGFANPKDILVVQEV